METKKFQSRRLTTVEKEFSKILTIPILRKEYIMRLNNGESLSLIHISEPTRPY